VRRARYASDDQIMAAALMHCRRRRRYAANPAALQLECLPKSRCHIYSNLDNTSDTIASVSLMVAATAECFEPGGV